VTRRMLKGALVVSRTGRQSRPPCRRPGCDRHATQASWGCRADFFALPPDIRRSLWFADRDERAANGRLGPAWAAADAAAQAWIAEQATKPPTTSWREPELPLLAPEPPTTFTV